MSPSVLRSFRGELCHKRRRTIHQLCGGLILITEPLLLGDLLHGAAGCLSWMEPSQFTDCFLWHGTPSLGRSHWTILLLEPVFPKCPISACCFLKCCLPVFPARFLWLHLSIISTHCHLSAAAGKSHLYWLEMAEGQCLGTLSWGGIGMGWSWEW